MKTMRWFFWFLMFLHSTAHAAERIRIATPEPNAAYLTFPLAYKKVFSEPGFCRRGHFDARTLTLPALNNGDIDYLTDIPQGFRGTIGGFPVKLVACYLPRSTLVIVGRPR